MKKILKSRIFFFLLGAVLFGSIGVLATVAAASITYEPSWTKANGDPITNVSEALDTLYTKAQNNTFSIFNRKDYVMDTKNGRNIHSITVPETGNGIILMSSYGNSTHREIVITYDGVEKYRGIHYVSTDYFPIFLTQFPVEKNKVITVSSDEEWSDGWHKVALFVF